LDPAAIRRPATYLSGRHKPSYMMQGLDASFDAIFFIGYHGSISGPPSVLSHTYNPDVISGVRLGGEYVGESGINALVAHAYGVPIALVSGDAVTLAEIASVAPDCLTVRTKESLTRFSAHHLHPEDAREQLRDAAGRALRTVLDGGIGPPRTAMPATLEVDVQTADMAEVASWVKGVQRSGERSVLITGADGGQVFRAFVAITYITRQAGGR
jgi:D-amino peptidase